VRYILSLEEPQNQVKTWSNRERKWVKGHCRKGSQSRGYWEGKETDRKIDGGGEKVWSGCKILPAETSLVRRGRFWHFKKTPVTCGPCSTTVKRCGG